MGQKEKVVNLLTLGRVGKRGESIRSQLAGGFREKMLFTEAKRRSLAQQKKIQPRGKFWGPGAVKGI